VTRCSGPRVAWKAVSRHVLVAGGGVTALEAVLALLAHARGRVRVTLLAPGRHFVRRSLSGGEVRVVRVPLAEAGEAAGFTAVRDALDRVEPAERRVVTQDGAVLAYDALVIALGARVGSAVPGAFTFRGPRDLPRLRRAFDDLQAAGTEAPEVVLARPEVNGGGVGVYELALLADDWLAATGVRPAGKLVVTPGPEPAGGVAADLTARGIAVRAGRAPGHVEDGRLWIPGEGAVPADVVVAQPVLRGPDVPGLPADAAGFVPLGPGHRVDGLEDVFAAGAMAGAGRVAAAAAQAEGIARTLAGLPANGTPPAAAGPSARLRAFLDAHGVPDPDAA